MILQSCSSPVNEGSIIVSMCGFLGLVNAGDRPFTPDDRLILNALLPTQSARGPDGSGQFVRDHVGLGHQRLAIRDARGGAQPWSSPLGDCVLVYNGELYNDGELRQLLADDFRFRSRCDTEVVMAAYLRWGTDCVRHMRGMFALAIYDFRHDWLWMVRDRFGVKPLFYAEIGDQFVFASDVNALVSHPRFVKRPDWATISHYLSTTRLTFGGRTVYEGVRQLEPAQELVLRRGRLQARRYWEYPEQQSTVSYSDAVDELQDSLQEAVAVRLTSDVPVGLFLSGGVDSSTIAAFAGQRSSPTYAACATTPPGTQAVGDDEELRFAQECAATFSVPLESVLVDQECYRHRWMDLISRTRLPLTTPSDVLIHEIAAAAKQHVGVVLGGEGSDELLCGYEIAHWAGYDFDAAQALRTGIHNSELQASITRQYGKSQFESEADHYFALNSLIPTELKKKILNPDVSTLIDDDLAMYVHYQQLYDDYDGLMTVEKNAILLHRINLESLLSRLDMATMAVGLEARVPFTDHHLVEQVFRLPFAYRIDRTQTVDCEQVASAELAAQGRLRPKRMLREVANRFMSASLANRRKASFPTGVQCWFQNDWVGWARAYLTDSPFIRVVLANEFHRELVANPSRAGMWLWPIMNVALWGDREFFARPSSMAA